MHSEQKALNYALNLLREDARGNMNLDHETVDSDGSEESDDSDDYYHSEDDSDDLHDSDPDDPNDQGDYVRACFSDDEEDFYEGNNRGNPDCWDEQDDSNGFFNGVGQVGSYERRW